MRFIHRKFLEINEQKNPDLEKIRSSLMFDLIVEKVSSRGYLADRSDHLYKDCAMVRFEDAKLEPKTTFRALAAFLDIPYTDSMEYCSEYGIKNPTNVVFGLEKDVGFSTDPALRTYNEYIGDAEGCYIEYLLQDAYRAYGYDFKFWNGKESGWEELSDLAVRFTKLDSLMYEIWKSCWPKIVRIHDEQGNVIDYDSLSEVSKDNLVTEFISAITGRRLEVAKLLIENDFIVYDSKGNRLDVLPLVGPHSHF